MLRLAAALALVLAFTPAEAKDTGLIYVSNEKSNNILVVDPKTYKVVNDIAVSTSTAAMRVRARSFTTPTQPFFNEHTG
jgi:YVTN family beta-propeller protein